MIYLVYKAFADRAQFCKSKKDVFNTTYILSVLHYTRGDPEITGL